MVVILCSFKQLGKYQVIDMNVDIKPLINEILKLGDGITMYDICKPIGHKIVQCHGMLL
jgi:hypothetical protein